MGSCSPCGRPDGVLGSWLWPSPLPANAASWETNQWMKNLCPSVSSNRSMLIFVYENEYVVANVYKVRKACYRIEWYMIALVSWSGMCILHL